MGRIGDIADLISAMALVGGGYLVYRAVKNYEAPELPTLEWPKLPTLEWPELPELPPFVGPQLPTTVWEGEETPGSSELGTPIDAGVPFNAGYDNKAVDSKSGKKKYHKPKPELTIDTAIFAKSESLNQQKASLDVAIEAPDIISPGKVAYIPGTSSWQGTASGKYLGEGPKRDY